MKLVLWANFLRISVKYSQQSERIVRFGNNSGKFSVIDDPNKPALISVLITQEQLVFHRLLAQLQPIFSNFILRSTFHRIVKKACKQP